MRNEKKKQINKKWLANHSNYECHECDSTELRVKNKQGKLVDLIQSEEEIIVEYKKKKKKTTISKVNINFSLNEQMYCKSCRYKAPAWEFISIWDISKNMLKQIKGKPRFDD